MYLLKIVIISYFITIPLTYSSEKSNFPIKDSMRQRVDFWKKVYTEISTQQAFVHDTEDLTVIYKTVQLSKTRRERIRDTKKEKDKIGNILVQIAKKNYQNLTEEEEKIAKIIGMRPSNELIEMSKRIRFQYGLKDRYYNGLIRSYRFLEFIKKTFKDLSLPEELVYLPHVESSFNYNAYSKVGAAGIWQFMRYTGRIYGLKINYIIDERRDPLKATKAAARLLKDNYDKLKSWPLALTAYNHGARSMESAINKLNTRDINTIIEKYDGRRFGFASKNFYATFMATVEISNDPKKYFKSFTPPPKFSYVVLKLDRPYTINEITKVTKIKNSVIKDFNHSIREVAYRSDVYIPKDFELKLPLRNSSELKDFQEELAKIKTDYEKMDFMKTHIVSSGESLYYISKVYKVNINKLISYNQIANPSQVYPGMTIKIPGTSENKVTTLKNNNEVTKIAAVQKNINKGIAKRLNISDKKKLLKTTTLSVDNLSSYKLDIQLINSGIYQIFVETDETIGHYAEWAKIKTQRIRELNDLSLRSHIILGQKLLVPLNEEILISFKQERAQFHLGIQEDFYSNYKVSGKDNYVVKRGDTVEFILKEHSLPLWLLRSMEDNGFDINLKVGQKITIPKIEGLQEESSLLPGDLEEDS